MNLKKIVFRDMSLPISQAECLFVIKEYIKTRKGDEVEPYVDTRKPMSELAMMSDMVTYAIGWFRENLKR